jgi:hypothetical protein
MTAQKGTFTIMLTGLSDRDREQATADLAEAIVRADRSVEVKTRQDNPSAMDFGSTLVLLLGSGAAVAVARGIQAALAKWQGASITIKNDRGEIKASGITSADAVRLYEAFSSQRQ